MQKLLIGIGDLHGHYPALKALLVGLQDKYQIFEDKENSILREGVELNFTGDYIDRGNQALEIIRTLMLLTERNPSSVHQLFGNHELMALGCLDFVRNDLENGGATFPWSVHGANGGMNFLKEFGNLHDKETVNTTLNIYVQRMSRGGDIGTWIRKLEPLHFTEFYGKKILFVHAGLPTDLRDAKTLEQYVEEFKKYIVVDTSAAGGSLQKYVRNNLVGNHSVFWDRSFPRIDDESVAEDVVKRVGVDHIVIGHTPGTEIKNYFNRIFNIDVGMTPAYGENEPAAIVFKKKGIYEFYVDKGENRIV